MKKFLINTAIFLIIILVLATVVDVVVSLGLRHTEKNHLQTMNVVMHETPNNDVLILGNSRAANGYDTYLLDSILGCNSYNLSVSGKAFRISNLRYQAYRRNNPAPKLIIINIDQIEMSEGTLGFENYMFYPYITDTLVRPVLEMNHLSWLDRNLPMYRYRGDCKYITIGLCEFFGIYHVKGKGYKGYSPNSVGVWNGENLKSQIENNPNGIGVGMEPEVLALADSFIKQAKEEGIQVVMVYSPLYYQVQEHLSDKYKTLVHEYDLLSQKYDIPIWDYQKIDMNRDSTYFIDGNHLNRLGAEVFTTMLANDIDSLNLY